MKIGKMLRGSGVKIIDLGGDYRFRDVKVFENGIKFRMLTLKQKLFTG